MATENSERMNFLLICLNLIRVNNVESLKNMYI